MFALGRSVFIVAIGLTVVYVCMFFYLRSGARMRAEEDWVQEGRPGDRDDWVDKQIAPAIGRIRVLLVIFVYVLPIVGLIAYVLLTN